MIGIAIVVSWAMLPTVLIYAFSFALLR